MCKYFYGAFNELNDKERGFGALNTMCCTFDPIPGGICTGYLGGEEAQVGMR
jgi:hypothetical protein